VQREEYRVFDIIGDTIYFRFSMIKMRLAAYAHFLHLSSAARMVVNTMRGIDFLLNRIAPIPRLGTCKDEAKTKAAPNH